MLGKNIYQRSRISTSTMGSVSYISQVRLTRFVALDIFQNVGSQHPPGTGQSPAHGHHRAQPSVGVDSHIHKRTRIGLYENRIQINPLIHHFSA
jgi:hypothetical protein